MSPGIAHAFFFLSLGAQSEANLPYDAVKVGHTDMSKTASRSHNHKSQLNSLPPFLFFCSPTLTEHLLYARHISDGGDRAVLKVDTSLCAQELTF